MVFDFLVSIVRYVIILYLDPNHLLLKIKYLADQLWNQRKIYARH